MTFLRTLYPSIALGDAVVLVTGGGRGIGRATAEIFAREGAHVFLGDVDHEAASDAAHAIGAGARGLRVDVTERASFAAFVAAATELHGHVDVLVNNAGVMPLGGFLDEPERISRLTMDVNVWGLVHGMRAVLPGMIARGRGHVVNVASMAGKFPVPGMAIYNASKFAALGLTAAVRREIVESGVSVSAVLPCAVRTGLSSGVPLGRGLPTVEPEVIARAVLGTCRTRRAEVPVPGYLAGWDLLNAILPERVVALGRAYLGDMRALTSIDTTRRSAYADRVEQQAKAHVVASLD